MTEDEKKQIEYHISKYNELMANANKCAEYAKSYDRDPGKITQARTMKDACDNYKSRAFIELEKLKNLQYDKCSHIWVKAEDYEDKAYPFFCIKCHLMYASPKTKRDQQNVSHIKRVNGPYMSKIGIQNYDQFKEYIKNHGIVLDIRILKENADDLLNIVLRSNPNMPDQDIASNLQILYQDYYKNLPRRAKDKHFYK